MSRNDELVAEYLSRLDDALAELPRARRKEVLDEIAGHIESARAELPVESEAELRSLLDRLGDPAEIAAEAGERPATEPQRRSALDVLALIMLLVGGVILPVVGWFVGLVLLWISRAWNVRDKLIGTLIVPGGLLVPFGLLVFAGSSGSSTCVHRVAPTVAPETCTHTSSGSHVLTVALVIVLVLAPVATTIYLARRRNQAAPA